MFLKNNILNVSMDSARNQKILIVDDEPNILTALEFLIRKAGYRVQTACNGEKALQLAAANPPDLIVLDVMMPGIDGFEVAKRVRQNPALENTRILFLTAKGAQADRFKGYATGGEIYITKPFDNEAILTAIQEVVEFG